jgi:predicted GH43/DUF377 family glycosyl hydrolase
VTSDARAVRLPVHLRPDPGRVVAQLFVPGHAFDGGRDGRASGIVDHVMAMTDDEVAGALAAIEIRFGHRHRDLDDTLRLHAERLANRMAAGVDLPVERQLVLGATFTHEYSVEAAALCNPSIAVAPDQTDVAPGAVRFVMTVRQIGEGHRSSIGIRTGVFDGHAVTVEPAGPFTTAGLHGDSSLAATTLQHASDDAEITAWVLAGLGPVFSTAALDARLLALAAQRDTRRNVVAATARFDAVAERHYEVRFPASSRLDERVLVPAMATESNGLEDARLVRFEDDDATVTYHATYTAYDGVAISQQLLTTVDFECFTSTPLLGVVATNKGLALFPRRIGGRYVALTRHDGATNGVATTRDLNVWTTTTPLDLDPYPWELLQVGNCGPPIELDEGWLVLTHGVGAFRTYSIGAMLLALDDPSVVLGRMRQPLLTPQPDEQDGYVPNVVYTCGALRHGDALLVPFGIADSSIGFARCSIAEILGAMERPTDPPSDLAT